MNKVELNYATIAEKIEEVRLTLLLISRIYSFKSPKIIQHIKNFQKISTFS